MEHAPDLPLPYEHPNSGMDGRLWQHDLHRFNPAYYHANRQLLIDTLAVLRSNSSDPLQNEEALCYPILSLSEEEVRERITALQQAPSISQRIEQSRQKDIQPGSLVTTISPSHGTDAVLFQEVARTKPLTTMAALVFDHHLDIARLPLEGTYAPKNSVVSHLLESGLMVCIIGVPQDQIMNVAESTNHIGKPTRYNQQNSTLAMAATMQQFEQTLSVVTHTLNGDQAQISAVRQGIEQFITLCAQTNRDTLIPCIDLDVFAPSVGIEAADYTPNAALVAYGVQDYAVHARGKVREHDVLSAGAAYVQMRNIIQNIAHFRSPEGFQLRDIEQALSLTSTLCHQAGISLQTPWNNTHLIGSITEAYGPDPNGKTLAAIDFCNNALHRYASSRC